MSQQETTSQDVTAVTVDSAPTETQEQPAVEQTQQEPADQAVEQDSAPVTEDRDSEPEQSKAVKELIAQRKKRQVAEQEAAYWRGVAEGKVKPEQSAQQVQSVGDSSVPVPPNPDNFSTFGEFDVAERQYIIDAAAYKIQADQHRMKMVQVEQERVVRFRERMEKAAALDPTLYEAVADNTLPISTAMAELIQDSEYAPDLVRYLYNNRKEAMRISQLSPLAAAKELGIAEAKLSIKPVAEPTKKVSQAPAPISTVTPAGTTIVDEADLPMDQFFARRNKAQYGR